MPHLYNKKNLLRKEPKQQGEISEPCVADLIQPIEVSDTLPIVEKDDSIILNEEKVPQGNVTLEGAHDVEVDEFSFDQPSLVHDDKQFAKVEKVDTLVLPMVQDNILIPHIDSVIPGKFTDVMECKASLFLCFQK